jgi:hypothetical protein
MAWHKSKGVEKSKREREGKGHERKKKRASPRGFLDQKKQDGKGGKGGNRQG